MADGDGRFLLNLIEELARLPADKPIDAVRVTVGCRLGQASKAQVGKARVIVGPPPKRPVVLPRQL
jgi:hypothetical protein